MGQKSELTKLTSLFKSHKAEIKVLAGLQSHLEMCLGKDLLLSPLRLLVEFNSL